MGKKKPIKFVDKQWMLMDKCGEFTGKAAQAKKAADLVCKFGIDYPQVRDYFLEPLYIACHALIAELEKLKDWSWSRTRELTNFLSQVYGLVAKWGVQPTIWDVTRFRRRISTFLISLRYDYSLFIIRLKELGKHEKCIELVEKLKKNLRIFATKDVKRAFAYHRISYWSERSLRRILLLSKNEGLSRVTKVAMTDRGPEEFIQMTSDPDIVKSLPKYLQFLIKDARKHLGRD